MEANVDFGKDLEGEALVELAVNTIRALTMDAVQKADSGHPGMPMGMADSALVLWLNHLVHYPKDPSWVARDRFILSAGHGSMLLYSLLHLFDYDLSLDDIKSFRQWESKTPGHPEYGVTPGVETTTGPLGQGFANGVGIAVAERILANMFKTDAGFNPIEHFTYGIVSDGDLMEGIASEAASLAGHLGLGKLIYIYDDNHITIDGDTALTFTEDVGARFKAYGWHVQRVNGHDRSAVDKAIKKAKRVSDKPSLIMACTSIACGSPGKQGSADSHGAPLGEEEVRRTKENLKFPVEPPFFVPDVVRSLFKSRIRKLERQWRKWHKEFQKWRDANPEKAKLWDKVMSGDVSQEIAEKFPQFKAGDKVATRKASGSVLQALAQELPTLVGGSADLSPSNNTIMKGVGVIGKEKFDGRNFHFGIREHAMGGILNGLALHGGIIPYGGTFLVFADYMRPSIRLAALMKLRVIYVFTHDSIFVGEDGPTHQPIEQLDALRVIPGLRVIRPADAEEVSWAWFSALTYKGPTALVLSRQSLPVLDRSNLAGAKELLKGGYVLKREQGAKIDVLLIATGSEVETALESAKLLEADGMSVRVVNMPCVELFEEQSDAYKEDVLPSTAIYRVAIEAGRGIIWEKYVAPFGAVKRVNRFGASAPYKVLAEQFGYTPQKIAQFVVESLQVQKEKAQNLSQLIGRSV